MRAFCLSRALRDHADTSQGVSMLWPAGAGPQTPWLPLASERLDTLPLILLLDASPLSPFPSSGTPFQIGQL